MEWWFLWCGNLSTGMKLKSPNLFLIVAFRQLSGNNCHCGQSELVNGFTSLLLQHSLAEWHFLTNFCHLFWIYLNQIGNQYMGLNFSQHSEELEHCVWSLVIYHFGRTVSKWFSESRTRHLRGCLHIWKAITYLTEMTISNKKVVVWTWLGTDWLFMG